MAPKAAKGKKFCRSLVYNVAYRRGKLEAYNLVNMLVRQHLLKPIPAIKEFAEHLQQLRAVAK
jgi:hypothetical protein